MLLDAFDPDHPDHPWWARFEFTKAHRLEATPNYPDTVEGTTPGFENFTFSPGSLDSFDQLWLFGHEGAFQSSVLNHGEQNVVHDFMNDGGGVLAMGDHEDLGAGLCGDIIRVSSMRTWFYQSPPPRLGMPKAPPIKGPGANSTVAAGPYSGESDWKPQTIFPVYRYSHPSWDPWTRLSYPHPILCGPRGAITVLPDHIHEGACFDPDLSVFSAHYPNGFAPEIIAHGISAYPTPTPLPFATAASNSPTTPYAPRSFGLVSVWDGQDPRAGGERGRVVVDSTWHHWFNNNLGGFRYIERNVPEYRDILCYFRNVAVWLASTSRQTQMRRSALVGAMLTPTMIELTSTLRDYQPARFYEIGEAAKQALGRIAPACQAGKWWHDWLIAETEVSLRHVLDKPRDDHNGIDVMQAAVVDLVTKTMAGAMFNAVAIRINEARFQALEKVVDEVDDAGAEGAKLGREAIAAALARAQGKLAPVFEAARAPKGAKDAS